MSILLSLLGEYGAWIVAAIAGAFGIYMYKSKVNTEAKAKAKVETAETIAVERETMAAKQIVKEREANEKQTETLERVNEARSEVDKLPDSDVVDKLRSKWSRD